MITRTNVIRFIFLQAVILFGVICVAVTSYAEYDASVPKVGGGGYHASGESIIPGSPSGIPTSTAADVDDTLLELFRTETENLSPAIDISSYGITVDRLGSIYETLVYCSPRSYYLTADNGLFYYWYYDDKYGDTSYPESERYVQYILPVYQLEIYDFDESFIKDPNRYYYTYEDAIIYSYDKALALYPTIQQNQIEFDIRLRKLLSDASPYTSLEERLSTYHNAVCSQYTYAYSELSKPINYRRYNTAYLLLTEGKGLCEAYSSLFNYILMNMGLDTAFRISYCEGSATPYHIWNMVYMPSSEFGNNEAGWFNIDLTWNELNGYDGGSSEMMYFLTSDDYINESHHAGIDIDGKELNVYYDPAETSLELDNVPWRTSASQIAYKDHRLYYIDASSITEGDAGLYCMDENGVTEIYTYKISWGEFQGIFTNIGIIHDRLYFSSHDTIYSYPINPNSESDIEKIFIESDAGIYIYTIKVYGGTIEYVVSDSLANSKSYYLTIGKPDITAGACTITSQSNGTRLMTIPIRCAKQDIGSKIFCAIKGKTIQAQNYVTTSENGSITFTLEPGEKPVLYLWDDKMRPLVMDYTLDGKTYSH